jgi:hypothetical protein
VPNAEARRGAGMAERLTFDNFFTGLLAALVYRGRRAVSIRGDRFDRTIADVATSFRNRHGNEVDLRFRVRPHYVHGYSSTVRDAIASATQADLISLDNPEYQDMRFKINHSEAESILDSMPGGREAFLELADEFLREYDAKPSRSEQALA